MYGTRTLGALVVPMIDFLMSSFELSWRYCIGLYSSSSCSDSVLSRMV